ncbi:MAG: hypothetical protein A2075_05405 [Geobacteraceae bacterium GWC2_58_44]|nr:MAG: hypothetical protein A2075_05405 [Geobacteraceae bacterium GWC2_58_44]HBG08202.1 hypothetical protein [Geobacter sp.]
MFALILLLALLTGGCATTYVPISWGFGEKVQQLSRSDLTLAILFNRYDPDRQTLRVSGASFDEVMMPSEVMRHLGAYRPDTKLIYRNLYHQYNDQELRSLMCHELAHHIWFGSMTHKQREAWGLHLEANPTPVRAMVRRVYPRPADYDTEDFAFTVERARAVDIEALARMNLITAQERDALLSEPKLAREREEVLSESKPTQQPLATHNGSGISVAGPEVSKADP